MYRSYLPGHLRKRSSFRDQLVVPSVLRLLIMQACHDFQRLVVTWHLQRRLIRVRDRCWWPTMQGDIQYYCTSCDACQRRKTPHRQPPVPTGHVPVDRPFQRVAIDLVEYKNSFARLQICFVSNRPSGTFLSYSQQFRTKMRLP